MQTARVKFLGTQADQQRSARAGLVGLGRLEIDFDRIRVVGKRGKKAVPAIVGSVVGFACMLGTIILMLSLDLSRGTGGMKLTAVLALVAGVAPGAWLYGLLLAKLPGVPVDASVARDALTVLRATRQRIDFQSAAIGGRFAIQAADAESQAVLAEEFNLGQTL